MIGSLLYLTATRPDIMYAVSLLSRFMQNPSQVYHGAAKRILRYLQGTKSYGIWYRVTHDSKLIGYTDSDWAGSVDDMKSTSGYAFSLGSGIFSCTSKKQATVAQSSAEAEYIATAITMSQAIWLKKDLMTWENHKLVLLKSTAIANLLSQWQRIPYFIAEPNILASNITLSEKLKETKK
ncbi:PREDICTED: uncharacterized protein LOC109115476 [Nelumbo nucifera]|uniref:Uncharacterized protein LOC109115476 n=1 Tax=Nelumbo nucifera TaxID=4432 RepID=A0A1U8Q8J9_NELNU|nr:PREDICTED: uncharacterized protein LOC109115476 [Nelumbo nucifera]